MTALEIAGCYRKLSQFHENGFIISWLQSQKLVVWLTPERRRSILVAGAVLAGVVGALSRYTQWQDYRHAETWLVPAAAVPFLFGFVYLLFRMTKHFDRMPVIIRKRPQVWLHLFFWLLLALLWLSPDRSDFVTAALAMVAVSFPYLIWRCGYMLMSGQRGKSAATRFRDHLFYIWPVWDGTNTPPGKGHDYLTRAEAQTPAAYARSVLSGIKLLLLVLIWKLSLELMGSLVYADPKYRLTGIIAPFALGVPRLNYIINGDIAAPLTVTWLSLYLELVWETLSLAAKGHVWIGVLRVFGFNVFRNTYKPLLAESVVDFWNRYYYYFKELMVEFFFLPAYLRWFRNHPRMRIVAAIFAAAFIGNMYYHLLQAKHPLIRGDFAALWSLLGARLIYCFLLAAGIAVSMLRQQKCRGLSGMKAATKRRLGRVRRIALVCTFFSVINFWNVIAAVSITERTRLFLSLFGW